MVQLRRYFFFKKWQKLGWSDDAKRDKKEDGRSSEKGYRLLSYASPQRKYYTPYGKIFFQMLWDINYICKGYTVRPGPFQKRRRENIMGLREDKSP